MPDDCRIGVVYNFKRAKPRTSQGHGMTDDCKYIVAKKSADIANAEQSDFLSTRNSGFAS